MNFWATLCETLSEDFESPLVWKLQNFKSYLKFSEIQESRMAQMVDFFTKPLCKNAQNQSRKGGSLETPCALNNDEWNHLPK